jgi:uncharacterized protein (TIGR03790 family)
VNWAARFGLWLGMAAAASGQGPSSVLVVVNTSSALSKTVGEYYVRQRHIPAQNMCRITAPDTEAVDRDAYNRAIAAPVAGCLAHGLFQSVLYIVTTAGVPLRVADGGSGMLTR